MQVNASYSSPRLNLDSNTDFKILSGKQVFSHTNIKLPLYSMHFWTIIRICYVIRTIYHHWSSLKIIEKKRLKKYDIQISEPLSLKFSATMKLIILKTLNNNNQISQKKSHSLKEQFENITNYPNPPSPPNKKIKKRKKEKSPPLVNKSTIKRSQIPKIIKTDRKEKSQWSKNIIFFMYIQ